MVFISGSITSPNPGAALYAVLAPALTTAGFVFVETVVTGTDTHQIWKSNAADNSFNLDWYLDCMYPTTGTSPALFLRPFEFYDPATNLGYRGVFNYFNTPPTDLTTYSPFGATGKTLDNSDWRYEWYSMTTSATAYKMSVTTDRIIYRSAAGGTYVRYCGFYQPTADFEDLAGSAMYPLCAASFGSSSNGLSSFMALTRLPLVGTDPSMWTEFYFYAGTPNASYRTVAQGWPASTPTEFGGSLAWDVELFIQNGPTIGRMLDMQMSLGNSVPAGGAVVFDDTATITENEDLTGGEVYQQSMYSNYYAVYFFKGI